MKTCVAVLLLILLGGCAGRADFQRPSLLKSQHQRSGIYFTTETRPLNVSPWDIRFQPIGFEGSPRLLAYLPLFDQELSRLPTELLSLSGLQVVAFVRHLAVGEQPRAAVPDYLHEVLYYDVEAPGDAYLRHVVHHEFYHMLEQQLYGSAYYQDPLWQSLNPPGFRYGYGGSAERDPNVSVFSHPQPGFINAYAMSGLEEDKAEIWAIIWAEQSWQKVQALVEQDTIVQAKIRLLVAQLQCQTPALAYAWPDYIRPYAAEGSACEVLAAVKDATSATDNRQTATSGH